MFSLDRIFRAPQGQPADALPYVLGLRYTVHTRAERSEIGELEEVIRRCDDATIVLDNVEPGPNELAFWLHARDPKRAFKILTELPELAKHMGTLQAAYAERSKMKFSILWPKSGGGYVPPQQR